MAKVARMLLVVFNDPEGTVTLHDQTQEKEKTVGLLPKASSKQQQKGKKRLRRSSETRRNQFEPSF